MSCYELDAALKDADEFVRLEPKNPEAFAYRSEVHSVRLDWGAVLKDLTEAIRLDPNHKQAIIRRACVLACCPEATHRDAVQAIKDADRACALTEWKNPNALEARAASTAELGDYPGAVKWQKEALEIPGWEEPAVVAARARLALYEANKPYRIEPAIDPTNPAALLWRGNYWLAQNNYEKAIKDLDEALRLDPKKVTALNARGAAHGRALKYGKAANDFTEAIRLDPKNAVAFVNRGLMRFERGEWETALADLDEGLRLEPKNVTAHMVRGLLRATAAEAKFRDAKKALEDATAACELTNWKSPAALEAYAAACAEAGAFEDAVRTQKRVSLDTDHMKERGAIVRARLELYEAKTPLRFAGQRTKE
ncbi:MAG TPA: tetratricopeptide repeat protein [Gemmata sp.]